LKLASLPTAKHPETAQQEQEVALAALKTAFEAGNAILLCVALCLVWSGVSSTESKVDQADCNRAFHDPSNFRLPTRLQCRPMTQHGRSYWMQPKVAGGALDAPKGAAMQV
jgi:hypothetical protein